MASTNAIQAVGNGGLGLGIPSLPPQPAVQSEAKLFKKLPREITDHIWKMCLPEPTIVEAIWEMVRSDEDSVTRVKLKIIGSSNMAVFSICKDSRVIALKDYVPVVATTLQDEYSSRAQLPVLFRGNKHAYINYNIDTLHFGSCGPGFANKDIIKLARAFGLVEAERLAFSSPMAGYRAATFRCLSTVVFTKVKAVTIILGNGHPQPGDLVSFGAQIVAMDEWFTNLIASWPHVELQSQFGLQKVESLKAQWTEFSTTDTEATKAIAFEVVAIARHRPEYGNRLVIRLLDAPGQSHLPQRDISGPGTIAILSSV